MFWRVFYDVFPLKARLIGGMPYEPPPKQLMQLPLPEPETEQGREWTYVPYLESA